MKPSACDQRCKNIYIIMRIRIELDSLRYGYYYEPPCFFGETDELRSAAG